MKRTATGEMPKLGIPTHHGSNVPKSPMLSKGQALGSGTKSSGTREDRSVGKRQQNHTSPKAHEGLLD